MAGEWIKVEIGLPEKPEVMRIARDMNVTRHHIVGLLVRFWIWTDKNTVDGVVDGVELRDVDDVVSAPGFAQALTDAGWLVVDPQKRQITVPKFTRHNGESAKKRALKNERQARWRSQNRDEAVDASPSTQASTREEKRRSKPLTPPSEAFERFWKAYPKRKARGRAEKAFATLNPDEQLVAVILAALEQAKTREEWRKERGKYIPHPATWLHDKGWTDEDISLAPVERRAVV